MDVVTFLVILLHGVISLPGATSCDKIKYNLAFSSLICEIKHIPMKQNSHKHMQRNKVSEVEHSLLAIW